MITGGQLHIRPFRVDIDDIEVLTDVLHKSYKQLADMGLRYVASHQDSGVTRRRIQDAVCLIGEIGHGMVATITYYPPGVKQGCACYREAGVGVVGQFGVLPEYQGQGLGAKLLSTVEDIAAKSGVRALALDTAEPATHLHQYYEKRGYRFVEYVDWEQTNYRSIVMRKRLIHGVSARSLESEAGG